MEMEFFFSLMEQKSKDFGIITIYKAWRKYSTKMGTTTKEICICHRKAEKESIAGITCNKGKSNTRESLVKTTLMDLRL